ncbi:biotin transporter BioY [Bradyrhizobium sp. U87765 SZCCT0131]|uniref:biotin transporter BioY n=1 Tax=unclassified Bradyrhizobium TaxID=2631580 RepID=UPI001BAD5270|nr:MULTISPECIES: biotin transporter BioY [unclassified Bradyrhizobium]MBR1217040.1 biotin transporter BioY [Bradyrhizobium sp. U87765 SZCCT0131]MBR1259204.1 biotin transporter BioY [Bradyrhizobium sp. U87765 SZCCT0134]MBR1305345.1 biotin transporter BioY [Bradyrhizobium sp. U87765 SZCCT0110]MBR1321131.1 biotin transporter BioY [Bradyrhizobium sp. U87765 SZCCT0109]MBR1350215.1 biotin transporter BioY [Bradyrhizobium sp. U87765 SZCCT0048]
MPSRAIVRIALLAAMIAVLGLLPTFHLPLAGGVPITAQTLGVMLAGIVLGPRHGALAVLLLIFVVALGAPLLAGGRGGLGVFFGPSVGFLIGWMPGAYVTGAVMRALPRLSVFPAALIAALTGGVIVVYACGIVGLMVMARMGVLQAALATAVFIPGDILKCIAAAALAQAAARSYPAALERRA